MVNEKETQCYLDVMYYVGLRRLLWRQWLLEAQGRLLGQDVAGQSAGWLAGRLAGGFLGLVGGRLWMSARAGEHQGKDHSLHGAG